MVKMQYEVILDLGETANKCTIAPLSYRSDFRLMRVQDNCGTLGPLFSSILLHHEGTCLTTVRESMPRIAGIATIDCVWRRLDGLIRRVQGPLPILARIPAGFETAYPRRSEKDFDPEGGLATIEAIFVSAALLGNWDVSLFSEYYFGRKFIEMNKNRFLELGVVQANNQENLPTLSPRTRNSKQRRRDRGKY
jgi:ribosome biogenesis protein Tsr3